MKIKQIQSNEELQLALERIEEIWEIANEDTQELAEINYLVTMVSDYEDKLIFGSSKDQQIVQAD